MFLSFLIQYKSYTAECDILLFCHRLRYPRRAIPHKESPRSWRRWGGDCSNICGGFRPALTMDVGYAILTSKSESSWQPANYEVLSITNAGEVRLGNFIHGVAVKSIAIDTVYYTGN